MTKNQSTKKALHLFVHGRVQGVGFRAWTSAIARNIKVTGWVRNTEKPDCVEVYVEGTPAELSEFTYALKNNHPYARVDSIEKSEVKPISYKRFTIER